MVEFCSEHCLMKEHIKESPKIRSMVDTHEAKLTNFDIWVPKIEAKVDEIPKLLNSFYLKIMFSVGVINVGSTILILRFAGGG